MRCFEIDIVYSILYNELEEFSYHLDIEIQKSCKVKMLALLQTLYLKTVLKDFRITDSNSIFTPMKYNIFYRLIPSIKNFQLGFETVLIFFIG